jgi:hypothetical protein
MTAPTTHPTWCRCQDCGLRDVAAWKWIARREPRDAASVNERFRAAMARVEELRAARAAQLARRDRSEWDCFFHFACQNSLLQKQAD